MTNNKNKLNNKYVSVFGLILFSAILILPFFKIEQIGVHSDWSFHAARVQQIYLNLKRGSLFTFIGTDTFHNIGNGNFLFYPTLFLYPWALLQFILKPIEAYLAYIWLLFIVTLLVSYFCMISYNKKNNLQAIFFAIIYTIAPYHLYLTLQNYVLGEAQAYAFLPLVLLGIYKLLFRNEYLTLAVGTSLVAYCHYVSLFITGEVLIAIVIIYLLVQKNNFNRILFSLIKAILIFVLLTLWQFIPLLTDCWRQNLFTPKGGFLVILSINDFITHSMSNEVTNLGGLGILLILTAFFGWAWTKVDSIDYTIWLFGILSALLITNVFPHSLFKNTIFNIIQFTYRYSDFAICFLSIICAKGLVKYCKLTTNIKSLKIIAFILCFILLYSSSIIPILERNANHNNSIETLSHPAKKYQTLRSNDDTPIILNNKNYNYQFSYGALYGETDYFPNASFINQASILNHIAYINKKEKKISPTPTSKANTLIYNLNLKYNANLDLPIIVFKHTSLKVDNKPYTYQLSKRGTLKINLKKGKHTIAISYTPPIIYYLFIGISLSTWIILLLLYVFKKYITISTSRKWYVSTP